MRTNRGHTVEAAAYPICRRAEGRTHPGQVAGLMHRNKLYDQQTPAQTTQKCLPVGPQCQALTITALFTETQMKRIFTKYSK